MRRALELKESWLASASSHRTHGWRAMRGWRSAIGAAPPPLYDLLDLQSPGAARHARPPPPPLLRLHARRPRDARDGGRERRFQHHGHSGLPAGSCTTTDGAAPSGIGCSTRRAPAGTRRRPAPARRGVRTREPRGQQAFDRAAVSGASWTWRTGTSEVHPARARRHRPAPGRASESLEVVAVARCGCANAGRARDAPRRRGGAVLVEVLRRRLEHEDVGRPAPRGANPHVDGVAITTASRQHHRATPARCSTPRRARAAAARPGVPPCTNVDARARGRATNGGCAADAVEALALDRLVEVPDANLEVSTPLMAAFRRAKRAARG